MEEDSEEITSPEEELVPLSQSSISTDFARQLNIQSPSDRNRSSGEPSADLASKPTWILKGPGPQRHPRPRFVWNPERHKRFTEAIKQLGEDANPKNIMELMNVDGLTKENVVTHLHRYQNYIRNKKKGLTSGSGVESDPVLESSLVPVQFFDPNQVPRSDNIMPSSQHSSVGDHNEDLNSQL